MKKCSRCGEAKPRDEFYEDKRATDGIASNCKVCQRAANKLWKDRQRAKREAEKAAELAAKLALGEKACTVCKETKPFAEFHKDKRAIDGFYSHCKACHYRMTRAYEQSERGKTVVRTSQRKHYWERGGKEKGRQRNATEEAKARRAEYARSEAGKKTSQRKIAKRRRLYPERIKAKTAVKNAIGRGEIPPIKTQVCQGCGVQAQEYHHPSYLEADWLKVVPLCKKCHAKTYTTPYGE